MDDRSIHLLARWQSGDEQAATELFERYAQQLIGLARARLPAKLAPRVDAEDLVQSVYRSFFVAARRGSYVLQQSGDLWRLLLAITLHKVQHQVRRHTAEKRSVNAEQAVGADQSFFGLPAQVLARAPSPEEPVILAELLEQAMEQFEPMHRRMIELRLQGYLLDEIAAEANCCRRTVRRVLDRFKDELTEHVEEFG